MIFIPFNFPFISMLAIIPIIGSIFAIQINRKNKDNLFNSVIWTTIFNFFVVVLLFFNLNHSTDGIQFFQKYYLLSSYSMNYTIGVDKISIIFVTLLIFSIIPGVILHDKKLENTRQQLIMLLLISSFLVIAFCSVNVFLFYAFSEASLFTFLLMLKSDAIVKKTPILKLGSIFAISSICFFLFFSVLSNNYNSIIIGDFAKELNISKIFLTLFLFGILLRIAASAITNWSNESSVCFSKHTLFVFNTVIGLLNIYYVFRFLPLFVSNKLYEYIYISILFFIIFVSIAKIQRNNYFLVLSKISNIMVITFCQILIAVTSIKYLSLEYTILLLINYIFSVSGIFLYFHLKNIVNVKLKNFLFFINLYFFLSIIGIPGTLGFYAHYNLFTELLIAKKVIISVFYLLSLLTVVYILIGKYKNDQDCETDEKFDRNFLKTSIFFMFVCLTTLIWLTINNETITKIITTS